jgi:hypothetical protein
MTHPRWHNEQPTPVSGIRRKPLQAVPKGLTNRGAAFALAGDALGPGKIERRALRPSFGPPPGAGIPPDIFNQDTII